MTLTELRYIVAVARERHFGRAAESCYVTQPTLSLGIKKLEDELGVTLFERGHQEVVVTPMGREIITRAERVLEEAKAVKALAQRGIDPLTGILRIGAIYTVGPYLFPSLLPILHERAPHMPLLVEENYTATLTEQLRRGELDVIIVSLPYDEPGIVTQAVYEEQFVVLLPLSHPWTEKDVIAVDDLTTETVLLPGTGHCFREQVLAVCPNCIKTIAADDDLQSTLGGSSLETIRHMVASGAGITVLPCTAACVDRYSQRLLVIRRFARVSPSRQVALAWRKGYWRIEAIRLIAEAICSCPLSCVRLLDRTPAQHIA